ncbi:unnamed protein product [Linum tenue]|uniref:Anthranilate synthase n=1 Tax=Linum tenue TaxID=586396 RepID=A0AAV0MC88_9ROSI|nr:unnamed protein product [Linum tenue]
MKLSSAGAVMQSFGVAPHNRLSPARLGQCLIPPLAFPVAGISLRRPSSASFSSVLRIKCVAASGSSSSIVAVEPAEFMEAAKKGNLIPLQRQIFSDQLTPVTAYRCLVREDDREAPSFLFESVEPGFRVSRVGRYSVVGAQPAVEIVAKENQVTIMDHERGLLTEQTAEDPMTIPRTISEGWKPQLVGGLPAAFCGGWVGFFSYDTIRYAEKKKLPFANAPEDDLNLPDIHIGLYDDVIVFDHVEKTALKGASRYVVIGLCKIQKVHVIHWVHTDQYSSAESAYADGMKRLETLVSRVQDIDPPKLSPGFVNVQTSKFGPSLTKSSMTSQEFADPFEVYRALRVVNPSPYMAYVQARGCILVASSPEILTRVKQNKVVNRPLAGTIKRGKTAEEDEVLAKQLLDDPKQCAEHIMLVDLGRNDVGKVSQYGSVKVEKLMEIERYSHVMHISSTVTGELRHDHTCWDVLRAALPVGTVSGAPKVRAMELIDTMEAKKRGPYSGGFGGISFMGDMDVALALRTMVFPTGARYDTMYSYQDTAHRQQWVAYLQAGAGIVADSIPEDEHIECQNKAAGLARAIDLAESAFLPSQQPRSSRERKAVDGN